MAAEIHFAESAREARRQDEKLTGDKPALAPEPIRTTENVIPARDRWKKKRRKPVKRIPGTVLIPDDVGLIDWWD